MINKILTAIGVLILALLIGVFVGVICAWPVQLLWNGLITSIFGLRKIGFWEAWGLLILCSILFKSTQTSSKSS